MDEIKKTLSPSPTPLFLQRQFFQYYLFWHIAIRSYERFTVVVKDRKGMNLIFRWQACFDTNENRFSHKFVFVFPKYVVVPWLFCYFLLLHNVFRSEFYIMCCILRLEWMLQLNEKILKNFHFIRNKMNIIWKNALSINFTVSITILSLFHADYCIILGLQLQNVYSFKRSLITITLW